MSQAHYHNIQDVSCSLEVDGELSPVGAIQCGDVHLFDIHFEVVLNVFIWADGAYTGNDTRCPNVEFRTK